MKINIEKFCLVKRRISGTGSMVGNWGDFERIMVNLFAVKIIVTKKSWLALVSSIRFWRASSEEANLLDGRGGFPDSSP